MMSSLTKEPAAADPQHQPAPISRFARHCAGPISGYARVPQHLVLDALRTYRLKLTSDEKLSVELTRVVFNYTARPEA